MASIVGPCRQIKICKTGGHKCGRGPHQEWGDIAVEKRHATLEQLYTLAGGFTVADGGWCAAIPGTYQPAKMGRRDWAPEHTAAGVAVIELPCDAPGRAPRASIPYI